jgi:hypothetical protein
MQPASSSARGANPRRRTQAQLLELQQEIVVDRDMRMLTWATIGRKHGIGEKEARGMYRRYVDEIAPLLASEGPAEQAHEYLRAFENVRQRLLAIADKADNDSARVGALRELVKTLSKEVELRQHTGLMPRNLADGSVQKEQERLLQRVEETLRRHNVAPEVYRELAAILESDDEQ